MPRSYPAIFVLGSSINSFIYILSILSIFVQVYKHSALDGCVDIVMAFLVFHLGCVDIALLLFPHVLCMHASCMSCAVVYRASVMTLWGKLL